MVGSGLMTFGITVVLLLPTSLLIFFAAKTAFSELQVLSKAQPSGHDLLTNIVDNPRVHSLIVWVTDFLPVQLSDLAEAAQEFALSFGKKMTEVFGGVLSQLPGIGLSLAIVVVSIYFFLLDGKKVVHFLRRNSFFDEEQTDEILSSLEGVCRSVILAALVSGGLQALLEILACLVTGTPGLALIGLLVFTSSFLPVVGTAPVTFGVAIQQFLLGRKGAGIVLLVMAGVIMVADNLVRPAFLKGSANLHPLLAFVAAFGGLQTLGFLGVFVGPILANLFVVTVQIISRERSSGPSEATP
ncbi:MAG: AI-2E family transporter [Bdellovibrio sp.]|nr:AI-2E family transporter [Bdellovibrio sp.]